MKTVAITNIEAKVWSRKNDFLQSNISRSLTQHGIARKINFKLSDIDYYVIKYESARMECVEYNTAVGRKL